jgi:hypothetical protein
VLVAVCAAFFYPLLTGHTFTTVTAHYEAVYPWRALGVPYKDVPQSDEADLTYPWRTFVGREMTRGHFPFWNPYSFGGQPFLANGSSGVLYPPNLIAALTVSPDVAHDAVSVFHVFFSGLFMYLLLREWQIGRPGALFSAVAWMLSSFNMAWLHLEVVAPMAMWLPLSLFLVSRALGRDEPPLAAVAAAAGLACLLVSGHLLFAGVVYGVAVLYAAGLTVRHVFHANRGAEASGPTQTRTRRGLAITLAIISIGPLCLAGVVLVPTAMHLAGLERTNLAYEAVHESTRVAYSTFRHLLTPPPLPATATSMHNMVFVGVLTPFLAAIGVFRRGPGTFFARLLVVGVFLLATDTAGLKWAYAIFPPVSFFSPLGRLLNLFNFGLAILAGVGFDLITRRLRKDWLVTAATGAVVGVTAWQLVAYAHAINPPFVPREPRWLYPSTPLIDALIAQGAVNGTRPGRIVPIRSSQRNGWTPPILYAAEAVTFGIDSAGGYDSTLPTRAEQVLRILAGEDIDRVLAPQYRRAFTTSFEIDRVRFALLPRLGITAVVAPPDLSVDLASTPEPFPPLDVSRTYAGPDGAIYQIANSGGGPWFVAGVTAAEGPERAARAFLNPDFDETRSVILERRDVGEANPGQPLTTMEATGSVRVREDGVSTLRVTVIASAPGWVVVPNVWDRGWSATVNGQPTPVLRANYLFQAVAVPAGTSDVAFSYVPYGFHTGFALTMAAFAAALLAVALRMRRQSLRLAGRAGS